MQDNGESSLQPMTSPLADKAAINAYIQLKEESEKLQAENAELKKSIEREALYHRNLYKQWSELHAYATTQDVELRRLSLQQSRRKKFYPYAFYGLLCIVVGLAVFNYNSIVKRDREEYSFGAARGRQSTAQAASFIDAGKKDSDAAHNAKIPAGNLAESKLSLDSSAVAGKNGAIQKNLQRYLVKSKSYFHNRPDVNTRRNTFVLPWNDAYGIVTALDDRNGFIYIIFTNRAGRTSRGWILKSDLQPL